MKRITYKKIKQQSFNGTDEVQSPTNQNCLPKRILNNKHANAENALTSFSE